MNYIDRTHTSDLQADKIKTQTPHEPTYTIYCNLEMYKRLRTKLNEKKFLSHYPVIYIHDHAHLVTLDAISIAQNSLLIIQLEEAVPAVSETVTAII